VSVVDVESTAWYTTWYTEWYTTYTAVPVPAATNNGVLPANWEL